MNISLTRELEKVIDEKVSSGLYNNASEVVRDAIRRAFCGGSRIDVHRDSPELATLIRQGVNSRHVRHKRGDIRKLLARVGANAAK